MVRKEEKQGKGRVCAYSASVAHLGEETLYSLMPALKSERSLCRGSEPWLLGPRDPTIIISLYHLCWFEFAWPREWHY